MCVVCAAQGYPGEYKKGAPITGLDAAAKMNDVIVFHAGTRKANGIVTNGGRVLGVTGLGATIKDAIRRAYQAVEVVHFDGMQYRKDIGRKAL